MPELPEVETCRKDLENYFVGSPIFGVQLFRNDLQIGKGKFELPGDGWVGSGISRHGKTLVMSLSRTMPHPGGKIRRKRTEHLYLLSRFGMSGGWRRISGGRNPPHSHLEIRFADRGTRLLWVDPRRFGRVELTESLSQSLLLKATGPDALSISLTELERILQPSQRSLRDIIMDQHLIAGIGNIYMAEILFQAGISPFRTGKSLYPFERIALLTAMKSILKEAIAAGGSTIHSFTRESGEEGNYQKNHQVYGREGKPCLRCAFPIHRVVLSARSLYYCSSCQGEGGLTSRRSSRRESMEI